MRVDGKQKEVGEMKARSSGSLLSACGHSAMKYMQRRPANDGGLAGLRLWPLLNEPQAKDVFYI